MTNQKRKSGILMTVIIVSAVVAALTTVALLASRFLRKKKALKEEECGEVFDYTFDNGDEDDFESEVSETVVFDAGALEDGAPFEGE